MYTPSNVILNNGLEIKSANALKFVLLKPPK
jgi:hypothetical protein